MFWQVTFATISVLLMTSGATMNGLWICYIKQKPLMNQSGFDPVLINAISSLTILAAALTFQQVLALTMLQDLEAWILEAVLCVITYLAYNFFLSLFFVSTVAFMFLSHYNWIMEIEPKVLGQFCVRFCRIGAMVFALFDQYGPIRAPIFIAQVIKHREDIVGIWIPSHDGCMVVIQMLAIGSLITTLRKRYKLLAKEDMNDVTTFVVYGALCGLLLAIILASLANWFYEDVISVHIIILVSNLLVNFLPIAAFSRFPMMRNYLSSSISQIRTTLHDEIFVIISKRSPSAMDVEQGQQG